MGNYSDVLRQLIVEYLSGHVEMVSGAQGYEELIKQLEALDDRVRRCLSAARAVSDIRAGRYP